MKVDGTVIERVTRWWQPENGMQLDTDAIAQFWEVSE
jgi:hypothetical protein